MKTIKIILTPLIVITLLFSLCPNSVFSDVIVYQENFEGVSPDLTNWGITSSIYSNPLSLQITPDLMGNHLLGSNATNAEGLFNNQDKVTLTLNAQSGSYSLWFDLYAIYTWDGVGFVPGEGGCCGPDPFECSINGNQFLYVTPNQINSTAYENYQYINRLFEYGSDETSNVWANIYTFKIDIAHSGGNIIFEFWGHPDQSGTRNDPTKYPDEPWALDNIKVSRLETSQVPEPATMLLLGLGLVGLAGVRRKYNV